MEIISETHILNDISSYIRFFQRISNQSFCIHKTISNQLLQKLDDTQSLDLSIKLILLQII